MSNEGSNSSSDETRLSCVISLSVHEVTLTYDQSQIQYLEACSYVFCPLPNTAGLAIYIRTYQRKLNVFLKKLRS